MSERVTILHGDSRELLKAVPDNTFDSCCTDPPYALVSITKRFGNPGAAPAKGNDAYMRASSGFMGQRWDNGATAFDPDFWREVMRVLKPGAHLVAFSGTRTYHRMACAIEDAGFEVRDMLQWLYGSGFPKSHDVSKGIDRAAGVRVAGSSYVPNGKNEVYGAGMGGGVTGAAYEAASDAAREWEGWGTALKPACEPLVLARKPFSGTVAANVLKHGTAALNVAACRVAASPGDEPFGWETPRGGIWKTDSDAKAALVANGLGRWPANVVHDGSAEVVEAFPDSDGQQGDVRGPEPSSLTNEIYGQFNGRPATQARNDSGSAARFFYSAKADANDRLMSKHPTVKPVALMRWLVRLVTPPNGHVLDCFAGSGTTGVAAMAEEMRVTLMEREDAYVADIRDRISHAQGTGPLTAQLKARRKKQKGNDGTLFEESSA